MFSYFSKTPEQITEEQRLSVKKQRINSARQDEIHRKPNPQQGIVYPEEDFFDFRVQRGKETLKLHTFRFQPKKDIYPKALVILFHGMLSHSNHGAHIAKYFSDIGCIVVAFDHRGHGKSQGLSGYVEDIESHFSDSNEFVNKMIKLHDQDRLPIFLSGLSMGGMTSFRLAIEHPNRFKGVILFAPAIKTFSSGFAVKTLGAFATLVPQKALVKSTGGTSTKNPLVQESYRSDPHCYQGKQRLGTLSTIVGAMLKTPWILIQGGLDKLVDPDVRFDLEKLSPSTDKTVLYYENCWHDIWHEEEILDAMPKVVQWIKDRL